MIRNPELHRSKYVIPMNKANMSNDGNISPMMRIGEAAKLLSIHITTMRRWSDQGIILSYRLGKRGERRFLEKDVSYLLYELHKNKGNVNKARVNGG